MFGRNKPKKPNRLASIISSNIEYSITHQSEGITEDNIRYLPTGKFNTSISRKMLVQLPLRFQTKWRKLDLDYYFAVEEEEESDLERISNTPVNLPLLSKENKLRVKAIALGLSEKNNKYSKEVGLWLSKKHGW
mgnify:FL=1